MDNSLKGHELPTALSTGAELPVRNHLDELPIRRQMGNPRPPATGRGGAANPPSPLTNPLVPVERLTPLGGVVDDRVAGLVDLGCGGVAQLGDVAADVVAVGVELLALLDGVEDAEVGRGVSSAAGCPLPVVLVG